MHLKAWFVICFLIVLRQSVHNYMLSITFSIIIIFFISLITGCLFPDMSLEPVVYPTAQASGFGL